MEQAVHTLGCVALQLGVQHHHILRLVKRGKVPFTRAGRLHLIREVDLPTVRAECVRAGYLHNSKPEAAHAAQ